MQPRRPHQPQGRSARHSAEDVPIEALSWEGQAVRLGVLLKPQCATATSLELERDCTARMLAICPLMSEQPCFQEALATLPGECSSLLEPGAGDSTRDWCA